MTALQTSWGKTCYICLHFGAKWNRCVEKMEQQTFHECFNDFHFSQVANYSETSPILAKYLVRDQSIQIHYFTSCE